MKFSIITAVYNREDCIERCLLSVVNQQKWNIEFEHIVVDDGSSDNTKAIIEDYAKRYPHICFIPFKKNKGTNAARNAAIARASGDYCISLDSDDYFVDDAFQTIKETVQNNPSYKHFLFVIEYKLDQFNTDDILKKETAILSFGDFLSGRINSDFTHIIRTETLQKYPFDERVRIYEGVFYLRFYKEAKRILYTKKIVTVVELGRSDSVTRESVRYNKSTIQREIIAKKLLISWFENDFKREKLEHNLARHYFRLLEDQCLISDYTSAEETNKHIEKLNIKLPLKLRIMLRCRLGLFYRIALGFYLRVKYMIKNVR